MTTQIDERSMGDGRQDAAATSTKTKVMAILEVLLIFALIMGSLVALRSTGVFQWEIQHLGWSYTGMLVYVGIPAAVVWLARRSWAGCGVSAADWRTNLDIGMKGCLVRAIPAFAMVLGLNSSSLSAGLIETVGWVIALVVIIWLLSRHKPAKSGRGNVIFSLLLLSIPIVVALATGKLSLVIVSTVVWQLVFSGFGEEFVYRGYFQSRLNQAFGRPVRLLGIQFGAGLIIASLLFGLNHALNTYDPVIGFSSLDWGWALSTFAAGLFFGVLRERTGTLLAPGLAHGLADAVGEPFIKIFGWM